MSHDPGPLGDFIGESLFRGRFRARPEALKTIRGHVAEAADGEGLAKPLVHDLVMAVDEACQNIIRHAYGPGVEGDIIVELRREGGVFVVLLRDFAAPVDVAAIRPRDVGDVRPGGLGVHLMQSVMDEVAFLPPPDGQGNLLRMAKRVG